MTLWPGPSPRVRGTLVAILRHRRIDGSIPACAGNPTWRRWRPGPSRVHPRVCGEPRVRGLGSTPRRGPSPRVRGTLRPRRRLPAHHGSIPACAGNPIGRGARVDLAEVHPRVCGEPSSGLNRRPPPRGPSPRVRGTPRQAAGAVAEDGSIPACAGNPPCGASRSAKNRVHPRVCGEPPTGHQHAPSSSGPSPRVRGTPMPASGCACSARSIPACAGNPSRRVDRGGGGGVHPRVCGEPSSTACASSGGRGPSPRVRGTPRQRPVPPMLPGSIPACAGNPSARSCSCTPTRVHPRVCGEPSVQGGEPPGRAGPSPRVRGTLRHAARARDRRRSIPACAGNPPTAARRPKRAQVHPRVCGEPLHSHARDHAVTGPSPRVRGTRRPAGVGAGRGGSIPACAGNPTCTRAARGSSRVHPRVCGEPRGRRAAEWIRRGPSPRVRGTPCVAAGDSWCVRSIPACAGNPGRGHLRARQWRVHPRVCGEPDRRAGGPEPELGPSPRVRGTPCGIEHQLVTLRSIPACAGNPSPYRPAGGPAGVHPRVCGEPQRTPPMVRRLRGPSPRVRGTPSSQCGPSISPGSIPACAGNPSTRSAAARHRGVHPRVCGEPRGLRRPRQPRQGPSPRVRGTPDAAGREPVLEGSIPACAGNPGPATPVGRRERVHPRVCGEPLATASATPAAYGPSPRVRGTPVLQTEPTIERRSIPACAGNPRRRTSTTATSSVHPRVCGEPPLYVPDASLALGPSPRVRGTRRRRVEHAVDEGSIPACAGNPSGRSGSGRSSRVHPRVCGEPGRRGRPIREREGPSPRVRGTPGRRRRARACGGSIPACAGNPATRSTPCRVRRVHPRVCGEPHGVTVHGFRSSGPSPRVRGTLSAQRGIRARRGSIPACAGNPGWRRSNSRRAQVHPRVCGEPVVSMASEMRDMGPSPRVRGTLRRRSPDRQSIRSIPACAGNPAAPCRRTCRSRVHPRVCGEPVVDRGLDAAVAGPSPRVRGTRARGRRRHDRHGSIPACAGNPRRPCARRGWGPVHPRVCGEPSARAARKGSPPGPSPRVRGTRGSRIGPRAGERSIPACAGNPRCAWSACRPTRVHPRVCGEPAGAHAAARISSGPSPRVRGTPERAASPRSAAGSIPACAGNPWARAAWRTSRRVHPRVCGEPAEKAAERPDDAGPSPRVRGTLPQRRARGRRAGSIPACAGNPCSACTTPIRTRVHPRVCGEPARTSATRRANGGPSPRVRGTRLPGRPESKPRGSIPACAGNPTSTRAPSSWRRVHPRVCGEPDLSVDLRESVHGPSPRVRGTPRLRPAPAAVAGSIPACAGNPTYADLDIDGDDGPSPRVRGTLCQLIDGNLQHYSIVNERSRSAQHITTS